MQATDLPLRDIHLPEPISWWPPAIGWWLLMLIIPLSLYLSYRLYKRLTRKTALKAAKQHFKNLKHDEQLSAQQKLNALAALMRRSAVSLYPRAEIASLTGEQWLRFLDSSLPQARFASEAGRLLTDTQYRPAPDLAALESLLALCEDWLNQQKEPKT